jgi:hypothetical protein
MFLPDEARSLAHATAAIRATHDDPHWQDLVLFHEYFHGDTGEGLRREPPTGWTALVVRLLGQAICARGAGGASATCAPTGREG